ncbi:transposable element Tcb1 transposase [Trichonephila clavipes]|nr:transposable element Tcb1 transposase [Trichonephila clavipes]
MWSTVAQRLTQITPPAATPDQLWQRVEAAWFAVRQEHIQSFFESMPRHVAAVIRCLSPLFPFHQLYERTYDSPAIDIVPTCVTGTLHLQTSMPCPRFVPKSYEAAVCVANHYTG